MPARSLGVGDAELVKIVGQAENVEEPENHDDHHHGVQDRLNRALHRNEAVDEP